MFEFESKPIAINGDAVLCQDGSIWQKYDGIYDYFQIGKHKKKVVASNGSDGYTEEFEEFNKKWRVNFPASITYSKAGAFKHWKQLTAIQKENALNSVAPYRRTKQDAQFLKRADTYLKEKMWESLTPIKETRKIEVMPDMNVNLRGAF